MDNVCPLGTAKQTSGYVCRAPATPDRSPHGASSLRKTARAMSRKQVGGAYYNASSTNLIKANKV